MKELAKAKTAVMTEKTKAETKVKFLVRELSHLEKEVKLLEDRIAAILEQNSKDFSEDKRKREEDIQKLEISMAEIKVGHGRSVCVSRVCKAVLININQFGPKEEILVKGEGICITLYRIHIALMYLLDRIPCFLSFTINVFSFNQLNSCLPFLETSFAYGKEKGATEY